jgi:branched-chain amino acid transport system substrate-binding protein
MKPIILIVVVLVVAIGIGYGVSQTVTNADTIAIGGISALTGAGAAIGEEERRGAQLAVDEINEAGGINGRKLKLISEDVSIDKINTAATVAQKLVTVDKVVAIVGPQWDEPAEPILPIIEQAQVPMIGADNSDQLEKTTTYNYFFSTWYDNRVGIRELLRFAQKKRYNDVTIIRLLDAGFWKFTADTFTAEASNYGVRIVEDIDVGDPLTLDFRTILTKVKTKNPDAVFIVTSDFGQCAFVKQAAEIGLNVPTLGTESSGDGTSLKSCPEFLENRYFSTPVKTDRQLIFEERYEKRYGQKPGYPSAVTAYDAVRVIAEALKQTNGEGGATLRDAIAATRLEGASLAEIRFNEKGFLATPEDTFEMKTIRNGQIVDAD